MFFDKTLMANKSIAKLWRAAHNLEFGTEASDHARPLHEMCTKLDNWVRSEHLLSSQRLSLRTSSTLVTGAARVLLQEMQTLFNEVQKLEGELLLARKRLSAIREQPSLNPSLSSSSPPTPELMMKQITDELKESRVEVRKRPLELITPGSLTFSEDDELTSKKRRFHHLCGDEGDLSGQVTTGRRMSDLTCRDDFSEDHQVTGGDRRDTKESTVYGTENSENPPSPSTKEEATQMPSFQEGRGSAGDTPRRSPHVDTTRPYACVHVYSGTGVNLVPSHIIVGNVDPKVLELKPLVM